MSKDFGKIVAQHREKRRLSQETLAQLCSDWLDKNYRPGSIMSNSTISRVEQGKVRPLPHNLLAIESVLGIRYEEQPDSEALNEASINNSRKVSRYHQILKEYLTKNFEQQQIIERKRQISSALASSQRILITGEPGMGKTTLLDEIAYRTVSSVQQPHIPIYVDLRYVGESLEDFIKLICMRAEDYKGYGVGIQLTPQDFEQTDIMFLFDHLDQAHTTTVKLINSLIAHRLGRNDQFIVCCRTNHDRKYGDLLDFHRVEIQPFEYLEIERLLALRGISRLKLDDKLYFDMVDFSDSPYRLHMLTKIREAGIENITFHECDVCREFIGLHIEEELQRTGSDFPKGLKLGIMGALAWGMQIEDDGGMMTRGDAEDLLQRNHPQLAQQYPVLDARGVKDAILSDGLISLSPDRRYYQFVHDLIQEFCCAWYMTHFLEHSTIIEVIKASKDKFGRIDERWTTPLAFYCRMAEDAQPVVEYLYNCLDNPPFTNTHTFIATQCFGELRDADSNLSDIAHKTTYEYWLDDRIGEFWDRWRILSVLDEQWLLERIEPDVKSSEEIKKKKGILALSHLASEGANQLLLELLPNESIKIQVAILNALGKTKNRDLPSTLFDLLKSKDERVRSAVVEALGRIGDAQVVDTLREMLTDEHEDVRHNAVISLGRLRVVEAEGDVLKLLDDPSDFVREYAIAVLGLIGSEKVLEHLVALFDDENEDIRQQVVWALQNLDMRQAVPLLKAKLGDLDQVMQGTVRSLIDFLC